MRHPIRKLGLWLALAAGGALALALAITSRPRLGEVASLVAGTAGITSIAVGLVMGAMALLAAIGHARLRRGVGVIARWRVRPEDWERFRGFDAARRAESPHVASEFTPGQRAPPEGVEILVGRRQIMIDGSYHLLRRYGLPELRSLSWFVGPDQLEVIEFSLRYPRGRSGGTIPAALRVPVAAEARDDAVRVFEHYRAVVPVPREGLAFRRPRLVFGPALGVMAVSGAVALAGYLMDQPDTPAVAPALMMAIGIASAGGAALLMLIIGLAIAGRRRPR
jgi:hypothetical protein